MARQALGKGLGALIPTAKKSQPAAKAAAEEIEISEIRANPNQPRKTFTPEKLDELIKSVKKKGVITPIVVKDTGGKYEIIAGERRFLAAQRAGLKKIPVVVRNVSNTEQMELALIENIQREDLNPIEEAAAYKQLMEAKKLTQEELADELSKSRVYVANCVRLLKLSKPVQDMVVKGEITAGHAKVLLGIDDQARQRIMAEAVVIKGMSVRDLENALRKTKTSKASKSKSGSSLPELKSIENKMKLMFGTKVGVKGDYKKGKIEIEYYSQEDLERILDVLRINL